MDGYTDKYEPTTEYCIDTFEECTNLRKDISYFERRLAILEEELKDFRNELSDFDIGITILERELTEISRKHVFINDSKVETTLN